MMRMWHAARTNRHGRGKMVSDRRVELVVELDVLHFHFAGPGLVVGVNVRH